MLVPVRIAPTVGTPPAPEDGPRRARRRFRLPKVRVNPPTVVPRKLARIPVAPRKKRP